MKVHLADERLRVHAILACASRVIYRSILRRGPNRTRINMRFSIAIFTPRLIPSLSPFCVKRHNSRDHRRSVSS